jgi:anti-sigma factor RsiW
MACAESLNTQAYFDGELPAAAVAAFERHLAGCALCSGLVHDLQASRARLRQLPVTPASAALRERIAAALDEQDRGAAAARRNGSWRAPAFWRGALAGAAASALAACALLFILLPGRTEIPDLIVSAHVRSLASEHLTDVISTDRHTVKPWFAGHADVSPAVADFAAQGYRLLGGRADYLEHQRAAVLVYQHGAHVINVFSWAAERHLLPRSATRDGYHMVFWRAADLQYCAVSDAGWEELDSLARQIQAVAGADTRE